jgi:DNA replication and repair protein RecF
LPFLSLSPVNFRNLVNQSIDLSSKEVFFVGENGQGKSNLLEALYYSSYGSSFRTRMDGELIKDGENALRLRSMYREENGTTHTTSITLENNKKRIEKDGKMLHDRKDLVNTMPCVLYNHDDLDFVIGSPERKRFFIDQSLSMYISIRIEK